LSSTLYWKPVKKGAALSLGVKATLQKLYGTPVNAKIDSASLGALWAAVALSDGNTKEELADLAEKVEKYGAITITEEF